MECLFYFKTGSEDNYAYAKDGPPVDGTVPQVTFSQGASANFSAQGTRQSPISVSNVNVSMERVKEFVARNFQGAWIVEENVVRLVVFLYHSLTKYLCR